MSRFTDIASRERRAVVATLAASLLVVTAGLLALKTSVDTGRPAHRTPTPSASPASGSPASAAP